MLVYIQWSRATPQDWEAYDLTSLTDWRRLPSKEPPAPGGKGLMLHDFGDARGQQWVLDPAHPTANDAGWVESVCIAGIRNQADHHYAGRDGNRLTYIRWNDAADWQALGDRHAQRFSFAMPVVDDELGILQPDIIETVWCEGAETLARKTGRFTGRPPARHPIAAHPWADWSPPGPANMVRHSVWMTDELEAAHQAARTFVPDFPGWASLTGP